MGWGGSFVWLGGFVRVVACVWCCSCCVVCVCDLFLFLQEALTPLGRHLAVLPVEICIGRLMLYGALFKCADPILLIAAALSDRSPFLQPMARRDEAKAAQLCFNR